MHEKPLTYKCPYCIHQNTTLFVDNDTHKNTITMLICYKLQNEKENNKLKMSIEDLNKQQKIKNDKIYNLADSLVFVTNLSNTFLNENKLLKEKIIELENKIKL